MNEPQPGARELLKSARECLARGDAALAERTILDGLRHLGRSRELLLLFAAVSQQLGKPQRAVLAAEEAISLEPDEPALWMKLGEINGRRFHWSEAVRAYGQAARLAPRDPQVLVALGIAQLSAQRASAAIATRDTLLRDFADCASAHLFAGNLAKALGDIEAASAAYRSTLRLSPDCTEALFSLVDMNPPAPGDPLRGQLAGIAHRKELTETDHANVEFAQARLHERDEQFDSAFSCLRSANARQERLLRAAGVVYQREQSETRVAQIIARYPATSLRPAIEPAPIDLTPIFIVGMPRSGTSLVEQILGTHPQVRAGGELAAAQLCEEHYLAERARRGLDWPADTATAGEAQLLMEMRERYLEQLFENDLDGNYVTDKLPGNFMSLGFIRMMFPGSIIVHCSRDPVATGWSLFAANLGGHSPAYTSLENIAHTYRLYRQLISHWRSVLHPAMVEVRYEELVADPQAGIGRLLEACGLPWDPRCLDFHSRAGVVTTASAFQVRRPLYSTSLEKWKAYEPHLQALETLRDAVPT